jgi:hypothetical protein
VLSQNSVIDGSLQDGSAIMASTRLIWAWEAFSAWRCQYSILSAAGHWRDDVSFDTMGAADKVSLIQIQLCRAQLHFQA